MIITKIKKKLQAKLYEAKMFCNTEEYCTAELQVEIQGLEFALDKSDSVI